ncbi:hypothetical protein LCGC14_0258450 [marine sediment metagenome]|uniref:Uncharacterized protein n=1 Tax=marine sediment metagenome TaxID=412755 RepID=A0A0F9U2C8_9ZZZZ
MNDHEKVDMKIQRPLILVGVDPGRTSGYGIHCDDLKRDFARGYAVPHDWHWGQCKGVNGRDLQTEFGSILVLISAYYSAEWTIGDESSGEPLMVLRGTGKGEQWFACPEFHFYIEDQFIIDDRKVAKRERMAKQRDALGVATSKGRWLAIAETFGFQTHQVNPTVWREAQLGRGWGSVPRKQVKRHAVDLANNIWGLGLKNNQDHGAEARFITEYGWIEQSQIRRMARAGR